MVRKGGEIPQPTIRDETRIIDGVERTVRVRDLGVADRGLMVRSITPGRRPSSPEFQKDAAMLEGGRIGKRTSSGVPMGSYTNKGPQKTPSVE